MSMDKGRHFGFALDPNNLCRLEGVIEFNDILRKASLILGNLSVHCSKSIKVCLAKCIDQAEVFCLPRCNPEECLNSEHQQKAPVWTKTKLRAVTKQHIDGLKPNPDRNGGFSRKIMISNCRFFSQ